MKLLEQADGLSCWKGHKTLKLLKRRQERRRARRNPECLPCYRRYYGYET